MFVPIMDNGLDTQHYHQQVHHNGQLQEWAMISQPPVTYQQQIQSHVHTAVPDALPSMKRGRVSSEESSASYTSSACVNAAQSTTIMTNRTRPESSPDSAAPKKARSCTYIVPRSIKPSVLSAMGTLAGGNTGKQVVRGFISTSVPMRRRLSGGQIDQFIGENNQIMESESNRPRSMSF